MLTASQRILYLKEISNRLSQEEWPLIDVTLTQFGLRTEQQWNATKDTYILEMAQHATDAILTDLAQHVGFLKEELVKIGIDPPFWKNRMFRLFISHLSTEKTFAASLQEALLGYGISGFVAHNDIEPTTEWQAQIETALSTADSLVALLHPEFHLSKWTDQEIGYAMGRNLPVFAVRIGQDPYGFIGRFQAFSGLGKTPEIIAAELFDAYCKNKQSERRMAEVLISLFEASPTFAFAKTRIGYLENLTIWDASFESRVLSAAQSNSQIKGSYGVEQRANQLVKKWSP